MSQYFHKVASGVDTMPLALALKRQPELFGRNAERVGEGSPHAQATDIWLRTNDRGPFDSGEQDWARFTDPHQAVWYPEAEKLPQARSIIFGLMARVEGEALGGVLITKLPPGGRIAPHVDHGWHAAAHDKFYIAIDNGPGCVFSFPDGEIHAVPGDVWWFRNDVEHSIANDPDTERLAMIVSIQCAPFEGKHTPAPTEEMRVTHWMPEGEDRMYAKQIDIPAGATVPIHRHSFTHKSILATGCVMLSCDDQASVITGPAVISIERGHKHSIKALTPATWFCTHAVDPADVDTHPDDIDSRLMAAEH